MAVRRKRTANKAADGPPSLFGSAPGRGVKADPVPLGMFRLLVPGGVPILDGESPIPCPEGMECGCPGADEDVPIASESWREALSRGDAPITGVANELIQRVRAGERLVMARCAHRHCPWRWLCSIVRDRAFQGYDATSVALAYEPVRRHAEACHVLELPRVARKDYVTLTGEKRGEASARQLREDVNALWKLRHGRQG